MCYSGRCPEDGDSELGVELEPATSESQVILIEGVRLEVSVNRRHF